MFRYDPPGNIDDLAGRPTRDGFLLAWHEWISGQIHYEINSLKSPEPPDHVPYPLFFSEVEDQAHSTGLPVVWNAFPLSVTRQTSGDPPKGWAYLDTLQETEEYSADPKNPVAKLFRPQDEYCEWHWYKDGPRGQRIVFTAEGPEYWIELAKHDLDRVVELYQKLVSPDVRKEDLLLTTDLNYNNTLLQAGSYDPFNPWNTERGIMHLTQPANTLGAEINLAARATVFRKDAAGKRIVDSRRLIISSGYGSPNRSSDPNIGYGVNSTAMPAGASKALSITLANPIGLYMDEMASRLTDKDDRPLAGWFNFVRGTKGRGLMAVLQPPEGDTRTLADAYVDGEPLVSGAQVASLIQMVVYAATADLGVPASPLYGPLFRACVPRGTDLSDLSTVNLSRVELPETCAIKGLDEAYPDIFDPAAYSESAVRPARRATRNG